MANFVKHLLVEPSHLCLRPKDVTLKRHVFNIAALMIVWQFVVTTAAAQEQPDDNYPLTVETDDVIARLAVSHDGKYVMTASESAIRLHDSANGKVLASLDSKSSGRSQFFEFARDNKHFIVSSVLAGVFVLKIDAERGHKLSLKKLDVELLDSTRIATASNKPLVLVGTTKRALGNLTLMLYLVDIEQGRTLRTLDVSKYVDGLENLFLSENGGQALVSSDRGMFVFDMTKGLPIQYMEYSRRIDGGLRFNFDGTRFVCHVSSRVTLMETGTARKWESERPSQGFYRIVGSQELMMWVDNRVISFHQPESMKAVGKIIRNHFGATAGSTNSDIFAYQTDMKEFEIDRIPKAN